jgi:hypothetical protein
VDIAGQRLPALTRCLRDIPSCEPGELCRLLAGAGVTDSASRPAPSTRRQQRPLPTRVNRSALVGAHEAGRNPPGRAARPPEKTTSSATKVSRQASHSALAASIKLNAPCGFPVQDVIACPWPNENRLQLAIHSWPSQGKARKRLHGENCAELFGI